MCSALYAASGSHSSPGTASAITAMDLADNVVVIGGRYQNSLQLLGSQLPEATASDAFVIALDASSQDVLWAYPTAETGATFDQAQWEAVVDLAILGVKDCGAVYIAGCSVLASVAGPNCVDPAGGKRGFVIKLDLATGQELWVESIPLENPAYDIFLPTALRAFDDKVYLAASTFGSVSLAGGTFDGTGPMESLVLELTR